MYRFITAIILISTLQGCSTAELVSMEMVFRDADTKQSLADAEIFLHWHGGGIFIVMLPDGATNSYRRTTDEKGQIKLDQVPEGQWKIEIDAQGYDLITVHENLLHPDPAYYPSKWQVNRLACRRYPFATDKQIEYRILSAEKASAK